MERSIRTPSQPIIQRTTNPEYGRSALLCGRNVSLLLHKPDTGSARTVVLRGVKRHIGHYISIVFHYLDFIFIFIFVTMVIRHTKYIAFTLASRQPGVRGFPANMLHFIIASYRTVKYSHKSTSQF